MNKSLKQLLILLTLLPLISCETAAHKADGYIGVPLPPFSKEAQQAAYTKILAVCGEKAKCPPDAVLEQATLDYIKVRGEVEAIPH